MDKLYLITGAAGHLGRHLMQKLAERRARIRALILPGEEALVPPWAEKTVGNVIDPLSLGPFFDTAGADEVSLIHCAAVVTIASKADKRLWATNVGGTENIVHLARRHGIARMIYVSSVHAIPERPFPELIREADDFSPDLVCGQYAKSKAAASAIVLQAARGGLNASIVHPSAIVGPGDVRGGNHMVQTIRSVAAGRIPVSIQGGYDLVDVRDVADGILSCEARGRSGQCYILSGQYVTIRRLMDIVCRHVGRRPPAIELPDALAKLAAPLVETIAGLTGNQKPLITPSSIAALSSNARFSHEKASRELGYSPRDIALSILDCLEV